MNGSYPRGAAICMAVSWGPRPRERTSCCISSVGTVAP